MSNPILFKNIQRYLNLYVDLVTQSNSLGLSDETVNAENLFCELFNTAFNWNLVNTNEQKSNQDTFDLIDKRKGIALQVTSNKNYTVKYNRTIESYNRNQKKLKIENLIVLFITSKGPKNLLKPKKLGKLRHEAWDIPTLQQKIYYQCKQPSKLEIINRLLQEVTSPVLLNGAFPVVQRSKQKSPLPQQTVSLKPSGIYIKRTSLIEDIFNFARAGNGLLIGGPGVGKSFIIEELQKTCKKKKIPCYIIRINELLIATDEEINQELKIETNWIKTLKQFKPHHASHKGILVFDAFDTAKDETLKARILKQIRKSLDELTSNWTVLASARTFDAAKSSRLLDLFPSQHMVKTVSCRYMEIPELSVKELENAVRSNSKLATTLRKCTPELSLLLRTPYFLKLLETITSGSASTGSSDLAHLETEEQLLEVFWNKKVKENTHDDIFLRSLTHQLVTNSNLSCPKIDILNPDNARSFDDLISAGIIMETSHSKENLAFSHNILLEFAISKYVIPEDAAKLTDNLEKNPKIAFLFRQSFVYFYSKIWRINPALFWKHYFHFKAIDTPLFRLFHQTVLNYILGGYYQAVNDLSPVFQQHDEKGRSETIRKILEGISFIRKDQLLAKDLRLFHKVTGYMNKIFLWELGVLLNKAIGLASKAGHQKDLTVLARASVNYLRFVLSQRQNPPDKFIVQANGGRWGIQNACLTYHLYPVEISKLIRKILNILKEDDFPIDLIRSVTYQLLDIYRHDQDFALHVYKTIYYHTEKSDKETYLGNSVVMTLRSNRRQDYESIHYKLEKDFKEMLTINAVAAVPLGIDILNKFSIDKRFTRKFRDQFPLKIGTIKAKIISDFSYYDSEFDRDHGPLSHGETIFKHLETLVTEGKIALAKKLVEIIFQHAIAALVWRRLLALFKKFPVLFKAESLKLLSNIEIFVCNETIHEAGDLIRALAPLISVRQRQTLEKKIISIPASRYGKNDHEWAHNRVNRLLNCIPRELLTTKAAKHFVEQNPPKENTPLMSQPHLMPYESSEEEKLAEVGVDTSRQEDLQLYELLQKLEPFNKRYDYNNNDKPLKADYEPLLKLALALFDHAKTYHFKNEKLKFHLDHELTRFTKVVSRLQGKLTKTLRAFVQDVALYYITLPEYMNPEYEIGDIKNRWGAFQPTPRTESTQILVHIVFSEISGKVAPVLLNLVSDNIQTIRLFALRGFTYFWHHHKEAFWKKSEERCRHEKDGMCLHELTNCFCYSNILREDLHRIEPLAELLIENLKESNEDPYELWHVYTVLILKMIVFHQNAAALNILYNNLHIKGFMRQIQTEMMVLIDPHNEKKGVIGDPFTNERLLKIMRDIVAHRFDSIKGKGLAHADVRDDFEIIDHCIQHLYFTVEHGKRSNKGKTLAASQRIAFLVAIKPLLNFIVEESQKIESGFMVAHTGYYFMQLLNRFLKDDPEYVLKLSSAIVKTAANNGFTYDHSTLGEIVKLTESILADHKDLVYNEDHFNSLITILDQFANSGWQEALELTWRIKEVF